ncbi:hypothetical protein Tcan_04860 [Toxocara canis]|uniref:Uncharacterized protein n=1 Tax=Toxocara canis TaxID=6265 RepID=A0A0B2VJZ6_TOXCA|nr:hypothetical protein Tcan_04860 [Toxocara canis]
MAALLSLFSSCLGNFASPSVFNQDGYNTSYASVPRSKQTNNVTVERCESRIERYLCFYADIFGKA